MPSAKDRLPAHSQIDTSSPIHPAGQEEKATIIPLPWIIQSESMTEWREVTL